MINRAVSCVFYILVLYSLHRIYRVVFRTLNKYYFAHREGILITATRYAVQCVHMLPAGGVGRSDASDPRI